MRCPNLGFLLQEYHHLINIRPSCVVLRGGSICITIKYENTCKFGNVSVLYIVGESRKV